VPNFNGPNGEDRLCDTNTNACVAKGGTRATRSMNGDCSQGNCNDGICTLTRLGPAMAARPPQAARMPLLARARETASQLRAVSASFRAPLIVASIAKCYRSSCAHSPSLGEAYSKPELPDLPPGRRNAMSKRSTLSPASSPAPRARRRQGTVRQRQHLGLPSGRLVRCLPTVSPGAP
jgi:hypothetical protein